MAAGDSAEAGTGVAAEPDAMASKVRGDLGGVDEMQVFMKQNGIILQAKQHVCVAEPSHTVKKQSSIFSKAELLVIGRD